MSSSFDSLDVSSSLSTGFFSVVDVVVYRASGTKDEYVIQPHIDLPSLHQ